MFVQLKNNKEGSNSSNNNHLKKVMKVTKAMKVIRMNLMKMKQQRIQMKIMTQVMRNNRQNRHRKVNYQKGTEGYFTSSFLSVFLLLYLKYILFRFNAITPYLRDAFNYLTIYLL